MGTEGSPSSTSTDLGGQDWPPTTMGTRSDWANVGITDAAYARAVDRAGLSPTDLIWLRVSEIDPLRFVAIADYYDRLGIADGRWVAKEILRVGKPDIDQMWDLLAAVADVVDATSDLMVDRWIGAAFEVGFAGYEGLRRAAVGRLNEWDLLAYMTLPPTEQQRCADPCRPDVTTTALALGIGISPGDLPTALSWWGRGHLRLLSYLDDDLRLSPSSVVRAAAGRQPLGVLIPVPPPHHLPGVVSGD